MAIIDTHRASYQKHSIKLGEKKPSLSPTITETSVTFYTIKTGSVIKTVNTLSEAQEYVRRFPNCSVVKSTRTATTRTTHKRIK